MCVICLHLYGDACGGQKRPSDTLQLELQVFLSHPMWVLEARLGPSVKAASVRVYVAENLGGLGPRHAAEIISCHSSHTRDLLGEG